MRARPAGPGDRPIRHATYGYDGGGSRIARTVNGVTMYTTHAIDGPPLSEYQTTCGSIVWTRDTVYAGGRVLGGVRANLTPAHGGIRGVERQRR